MTEVSETFAMQIRSLRKIRGLSVKDLADFLGVSTVTIWKWEKGDAAPRSPMLARLNKILNGNLDDLARLTDARRKPSMSKPKAAGQSDEKNQLLTGAILEAKRMIAAASGADPSRITIIIEY